jgi:hypothetical protein
MTLSCPRTDSVRHVIVNLDWLTSHAAQMDREPELKIIRRAFAKQVMAASGPSAPRRALPTLTGDMRNALARRRSGIAQRYFCRRTTSRSARSLTKSKWAAIRLTMSSAANVEGIPQGSVLTAFARHPDEEEGLMDRSLSFAFELCPRCVERPAGFFVNLGKL